jgi:hypothetical protein
MLADPLGFEDPHFGEPAARDGYESLPPHLLCLLTMTTPSAFTTAIESLAASVFLHSPTVSSSRCQGPVFPILAPRYLESPGQRSRPVMLGFPFFACIPHTAFYLAMSNSPADSGAKVPIPHVAPSPVLWFCDSELRILHAVAFRLSSCSSLLVLASAYRP